MHITISLIQMNVALGRPDLNLARAREGVRQAAEAWVKRPDGKTHQCLVVLPELWGSGYDLTRTAQHADELGTGLFAKTASLARSHGVYLVGSLLERQGDEFFNTAVLYDPRGNLRAFYRKTHLFRLMDEPQYLRAGDDMPVLDLPWGRTALAICYDLRFPELFRRYALEGAIVVVIPAQWPARRVEHWQTLLQARAIENQCWVVAPAQFGRHSARRYSYGHTAIIDPWGTVVGELGKGAGVVTARIDLARVERVRRGLPVLDHLRRGLFAPLPRRRRRPSPWTS